MEFALFCNDENDRVDALQFHQRAGPNYQVNNILPYCEVCRNVVHLYGVHRPDGPTRFDHANLPTHADPYDDCPAANRNARRFVGLNPTNFNSETGSILRQQFFEDTNLTVAYQFMHQLAGGRGQLSVEMFNLLINRANSRRVWDYVNLQLWCVPFILMTLGQFNWRNQFDFHFGFTRRRGDPAEFWDNNHPTDIVAYFSDSGREIRHWRREVSETSLERQDTWVSTDLIKRLQTGHGHLG